MPRRKTTKEFIQNAKEVHGDKYDYSKTNYKNSRTKVTIICPEHGEFEQLANNHVMGAICGKCATNTRKTTKQFIQDAKEVHGDKYDYSETDYKGWHNEVIIFCPKHGKFEQLAGTHLEGHGCKKCAIEKLRNDRRGWVNERCKLSNNFDSFKLYILKIGTNKEKFYKIGRTYRTIDDRTSQIPYQCNIIHIKKSKNPEEIIEMETKFINMCKEYLYKPNKEFSGMKRECFTSIDPIVKFLD